MRFTSVALSAAISTSVLAYPGMGSGSLVELHKSMHLAERQAGGLIGGLDQEGLSKDGQTIANCLLETSRGNCEVADTKVSRTQDSHD